MPSSEGSSNPGINPASLMSPALQVDSLPLSYQGSPIRLYKTHKLVEI